MLPILTSKEAEKILAAEKKVMITLDLGQTITEVLSRYNKVVIDGQKIPLEEIKKTKEGWCYLVQDNHLHKLAFFSPETNFYYKLIPTEDWPTVTLSSTPMHRHTKISPKKDTLLKIETISPITGKVLDTCCGLGYTAIVAAEKASQVYTFERDKNMREMAKRNPYSQELFTNKKIVLKIGDIIDEIKQFRNKFFDRIIHDPPTFKYAPELYGLAFYKELFRVLQDGGMLYHYVSHPHKTRGEVFYQRLIPKLRQAGFKKIAYVERASGLVGKK